MGKKAPMWIPSKKELEKILEVDNVHELFLVGQVCIERMLEKILEKKFNIPIEALDDPMIMCISISYTVNQTNIFFYITFQQTRFF